jgi:hypothetical protein
MGYPDIALAEHLMQGNMEKALARHISRSGVQVEYRREFLTAAVEARRDLIHQFLTLNAHGYSVGSRRRAAGRGRGELGIKSRADGTEYLDWTSAICTV